MINFDSTSPLGSASACSVVAADGRSVVTCSRFGRPSAVVSAVLFCIDSRNRPPNASTEPLIFIRLAKPHGAMSAPPSSEAERHVVSSNSGLFQPSEPSVLTVHDLSETTSIVEPSAN